MRKFYKAMIFLLLLSTSNCFSQIFEVPQSEKGFFINDEPTITFLYASDNAKATLIFIPGGNGSVGVKKHWTLEGNYFSKYHFNKMLSSLADKNKTDGFFNVVIFDNPTSLGIGNSLPLRGGKDHLTRIESVISFYKSKFNMPVWLMGHSAGGVSVGEFMNYVVKNKKEELVSGMIFSAGRNDSSFNTNYDVPSIFLIHQDDACFNTTPSRNRQMYENFKKSNKSNTEFYLIKSGTSQTDPCTSGQHMYFGGEEETASTINSFAKSILIK